MVRACVLEFAVESEAEINLARAIRLIDGAVLTQRAELLVLPSGLAPSVELADDATFEDEPLCTPLLRSLAERAARHRVHLVTSLDFTARAVSHHAVLLIGPNGQVHGSVVRRSDPGAADTDDGETPEAATCDTPFGRIGLIAGRSLARFEAARVAVLHGARVLCAPFAAGDLGVTDEHPSARALENAVYVLCASGRLPAWHERTSRVRSRIIGCDGVLLGEAGSDSECSVTVEIALDQPEDHGSVRPLELRRPELYRGLQNVGDSAPRGARPRRSSVAAVSLGDAAGEAALDLAVEIVGAFARAGVELVVLPALLGQGAGELEEQSESANFAKRALRALCEACAGTPTHVVTSIVEEQREGYAHVGLVLGHAGVVARRTHSHLGSTFQWSQAGRRTDSVLLPWGRLAIALPDELYVPELAALWSSAGVDVVAVPELDPTAAAPGVLGRQWASEHGLCVAIASRRAAVVESPALSLELVLPENLPESVSVVARKLRFDEAASSPPVRAPWQRTLWSAPRFASVPAFTPSLVEAVLAPGLELLRGGDVSSVELIDGDEPFGQAADPEPEVDQTTGPAEDTEQSE